MDTLVLSPSYEPMYRVAWERAMGMWASARVEVLEAYRDRFIHSVTLTFEMPAVIRFLHGGTPWRGGLKYSRENIYARDRGRCQYCGRLVTRRQATYDHVVPRSQGGGKGWGNIVVACRPCNQRKADRTPALAGMALLHPPEKPRSLPTARDLLGFEDGMPEAWRPYLPLRRN